MQLPCSTDYSKWLLVLIDNNKYSLFNTVKTLIFSWTLPGLIKSRGPLTIYILYIYNFLYQLKINKLQIWIIMSNNNHKDAHTIIAYDLAIKLECISSLFLL